MYHLCHATYMGTIMYAYIVSPNLLTKYLLSFIFEAYTAFIADGGQLDRQCEKCSSSSSSSST